MAPTPQQRPGATIYSVAALAGVSIASVSLVLPELTGPYYSELLMGFESRAAELGQSVVLMLAGGKADPTRAVRQLAARVDGLAMLGSAAIPESAVRALQGSKPLLLIAGDPHEGIEAI